MGAVQPNVQRVPGTGRISVEMPGIKDIDRVKKMLQTSAKLQFWEVQQIQEISPYFEQLQSLISTKGDSMGVTKNVNIISLLQLNTLKSNGVANWNGSKKSGLRIYISSAPISNGGTIILKKLCKIITYGLAKQLDKDQH